MVMLQTPSFRMSLGTLKFAGNAHSHRVMSIQVKQVRDAPSSFTVTLDDHDGLYSEKTPIKEGQSAQISLGYVGSYEEVMLGTVTRVEVKRELHGRNTFIVEGKDFMQRLKQGRASDTWSHMRDSDVLSDLAQKSNLGIEIQSTQVVHDYVMKNAQSDLNFILERTQRNGWTVFCEGKKLVFRKPYQGDAVCSLTFDASSVKRDSGQRVLSKLSFSASSAKVPSEVVVRHYDPAKKRKIEGKCSALKVSKDGSWPLAFDVTGGGGGHKPVIITDQPVRSIDEAEVLARRRMLELADALMQGRGECEGDGRIRAGKVVDIDTVGEDFDGPYYILECTHKFTVGGGGSDGYQVAFTGQRVRQAL